MPRQSRHFHGIEAEPGLRSEPKPASGPVSVNQEPQFVGVGRPVLDRDQAAQAEPALGGRGHGDWSAEYAQSGHFMRRWLLLVAIAVSGGPIAVLTALLASSGHSSWGILQVVVIGPLVEELAKILPLVMLAERKPWLLPAAPLIFALVALSGLGFAVIENLLYLQVYIKDPSPELVAWRWQICTALHIGCAVIAGFAILRIRACAQREQRRGRIEDGAPWIIAAACLHGAYNAFAVAWEQVYPF